MLPRARLPLYAGARSVLGAFGALVLLVGGPVAAGAVPADGSGAPASVAGTVHAAVLLPDPDGSTVHPRLFPAPLEVAAPGASALADLLASRSTSDPASPWVVVNKSHPLDPVDWAPAEIVGVGAVQVQAVVADPLNALVAAAAADGLTIPLLSGYRSYEDQQRVYDGWVTELGQERADQVSARPGYSEHQTGLAVDVGSASDPACDFEECYATTAEGQWLVQNAGRFGFVIRYTAEGRATTGYDVEGWHLRWVGTEAVDALAASGATTLEDLFGVSGGWQYR